MRAMCGKLNVIIVLDLYGKFILGSRNGEEAFETYFDTKMFNQSFFL